MRYRVICRAFCDHSGKYNTGDKRNVLDKNIRIESAARGVHANFVDLWGRQLLQALCHIHSFNYVHADIKVSEHFNIT